MGELGSRLVEALSRVEGPRKPRGIRHPLPAILALAVCAMLGGARSLYTIAQWGRGHPELAQSLGMSMAETNWATDPPGFVRTSRSSNLGTTPAPSTATVSFKSNLRVAT